MDKFKLKVETLPTRCEICHQSDLFDARNNYCSRCLGRIYYPANTMQNIGRLMAYCYLRLKSKRSNQDIINCIMSIITPISQNIKNTVIQSKMNFVEYLRKWNPKKAIKGILLLGCIGLMLGWLNSFRHDTILFNDSPSEAIYEQIGIVNRLFGKIIVSIMVFIISGLMYNLIIWLLKKIMVK